MILSRTATWWSRGTRSVLSTPRIASVRLFSAAKQQSAKQTSEDLPANLILSDSRILQPEQPFNYVKADKLPASKFCVNVLEGPFSAAKAADKVSPVNKIFLSEEIFRTDVRPDVMARIVRWQRNNAMQGTHKAKSKGEVSGTGKKPYKQKGTGLARQGGLRNPQFRGGGAVFGPTPRDHGHDINKKERRLGLRSALAARMQEGRLIVIDHLNPREEDKPVVDNSNSEPQAPSVTDATAPEASKEEEGEAFVKTRQMTDYCKKLGLKTAVIVDTEQKETLVRACRNARQIHYLPQVGLNVYAILKNKHLIVTVDALRMLEDRLSETKQRERRYMKRGWTEEDAKLKEQRDQESGKKMQGRIAFRRALFRKAIEERSTVLPVDRKEGA